MARIELKAKAATGIFKMIQSYSPEDVQVTVAVVAVGGGGSGTNVPMPSRGVLRSAVHQLQGLPDAVMPAIPPP